MKKLKHDLLWGMGLFLCLFLVFLLLKLFAVPELSWCIVTAPLWLPIALIIGVAVIVVVVHIIVLIGVYTYSGLMNLYEYLTNGGKDAK